MKALQDYSFTLNDVNDVKKLVIFLHGYGADGKDLISIAPIWADHLPKGTVFYAPNAPESCEMSPMGFQWFSLQNRNPEAMKRGAGQAHETLRPYILDKIQKHNLSLKDVAIVGFSQGTMMALYTMPQLSESCAGVLGYSGRLLDTAHLNKKFPVCAIHGTADDIVPFDSLDGIKQGLKGYDVQTHECNGLGHGIDDQGLRIGLEFLKNIL